MEKSNNTLFKPDCETPIAAGIRQTLSAIVGPKNCEITEEVIKLAEPERGKELTLTDRICPGAIIRIRHNGNSGVITRTFAYRFIHPQTGKYTKSTFGQFPDMSLEQARIIWAELDRKYRSGTLFPVSTTHGLCNPSKSFNEAFETWIESSVEGSQEHVNKTRARFENHVLPYLGNLPIASITVPMIIQTLEPLEKENKLETVRRIIGRIKDIFDKQVTLGIVQSHNVDAALKYYKKPKKQNLKAVDYRELPSVLNVIATASIDVQTQCLMLFQIHTMVRPVEAVRAKWCDIDLEQCLWIFINRKDAGQSHNTGVIEPHKVPLSTHVMAIIQYMRQLQSLLGKSQYLFPNLGNEVDNHMSSQTCNNVLKKNGFKDKQHAHGFRTNASTIMNTFGMNFDLIEKSLSHVEQSEVRRAYNRADYIEKRRELHQWWSDYVESQFKGNYPTFSLKK